MKMPDSNSAALRDYECRQDERERSYERLLPRATEILKQRLLGDRPSNRGESNLFSLAEHILNSSTHWLIDEEFVANLIIEHYGKGGMLGSPVTIYADKAIEEIINSERGQQELEDIVTELEEDDPRN